MAVLFDNCGTVASGCSISWLNNNLPAVYFARLKCKSDVQRSVVTQRVTMILIKV